MERNAVNSSLAASVGYDHKEKILEIEFRFKGGVWQYFNVPENVYNEMMSGSIGIYFNTNIKGRYKEVQVAK